MDAIDTITEREGFTAKLFYDTDAQSPDSWDNLATFTHAEPYTFGDSVSEPERGWAVQARYLTLSGEAAAVLPVYIEARGGQTTAYETTPDHANGLLWTTHKRINELAGEEAQYHEPAWILGALRGELETWKQYLEGDVYGYVITDPRGEHLDSCWGFYGREYAEQEAREAFDHAVEQAKADYMTRARTMARAFAQARTRPA